MAQCRCEVDTSYALCSGKGGGMTLFELPDFFLKFIQLVVFTPERLVLKLFHVVQYVGKLSACHAVWREKRGAVLGEWVEMGVGCELVSKGRSSLPKAKRDCTRDALLQGVFLLGAEV